MKNRRMTKKEEKSFARLVSSLERKYTKGISDYMKEMEEYYTKLSSKQKRSRRK